MKKILTLFLFLQLTNLAHSQEVPFSTNDLSILFPIDSQNLLPIQRYSITNAKLNILTLQNFNQILNGADSNRIYLDSNLKNPKKWYLVALRYTPCNFLKGALKSCVEQIRLVYQPVGLEAGSGFLDYAMHVVYNFNESAASQKTARLESFRVLKNSTGGKLLDKTLQQHPILASAAGSSYMETLRAEVIEKHLSNRRPSFATFMGLKKSGNSFDAHH